MMPSRGRQLLFGLSGLLALGSLIIRDAFALPVTSFVSNGPVGAEVGAFPMSGGSSPSGSFTLTRIPVGATIEQAWLYGDGWPGGGPSAVFAGTPLGAGVAIDSNTHHVTFRWDVTSLIAGNGSYAASATGFATNHGLGLVVAFRHPSLPAGRVIINDGSGELAHGTTFAESTTFDALAGPATLWLYTNGDDPGPLPVTGEEIRFNGAIVGGPIDANLGLRASLFEIPVTAVDGVNTLEIRTPADGGADNFGWPLAVLISSALPDHFPPFSANGARCQAQIGKVTGGLHAKLQKKHARCLDMDAAGQRACDTIMRETNINRAIERAKAILDEKCSQDDYGELGFSGTADAVRDGLVQKVIDSAEALIRATYAADYANKP